MFLGRLKQNKCSDSQGGHFSNDSLRCKGFVATFWKNFLPPSSVVFCFVRVSAAGIDRFDPVFTGKKRQWYNFSSKSSRKESILKN
jgi:hypothetical protein